MLCMQNIGIKIAPELNKAHLMEIRFEPFL